MISNLNFGPQYGPYLDFFEQTLKLSLPLTWLNKSKHSYKTNSKNQNIDTIIDLHPQKSFWKIFKNHQPNLGPTLFLKNDQL